jgi:putative Mg2+ transporter-C (MgtC) family protein
MTLELELLIRLFCAGIIGAVIGYEREFRGKGAGVRTHLLVALGSCLFMIISQYGFPDAVKFDAARIAAGVVGGLGFLGGGIIMKTSNHVTGLTTAAGIWVTGAIGLAVGSGLYGMAILCVVILMICMEAMHFYTFRFGDRQVSVTMRSQTQKAIEDVVNTLGKRVSHCSWTKDGDGYKASFLLLINKREYPEGLMKILHDLPGVELTSLD